MNEDAARREGPGAAEIDGLDLLLEGAFAPAFASSADGSAAEVRDEFTSTAVAMPERYQVLGELGRGGVGLVLEAEDGTLGRRVAVKVLQQRHVQSTVMVRRFSAEAQIGAQLQHPGILGVHDVGRTADDRPFFTMRLVPGATLAALLAERSQSERQLSRWVPVFARVCDAVAYAHARGVVHRDLKPGNVLVGSFGEVLVTDWGMAKLVAGDGSTLADALGEDGPVVTGGSGRGFASVTGSLCGTPAYMAPEQARGDIEAVTPQTDVFGLGAILCEILTGAPPYTGERELVLVQARLADLREAEARLRRSEGPRDLVELALACLAVDPAARPAQARSVATAVQEHLASVQERAQQAALAMARAEARIVAERRARRLQSLWFATILAVFLLGGAIWSWVEHEAGLRMQRSEQAVAVAMAQAQSLWREAAKRGSEGDWRAVTTAAAAAVALASAGDASREVVAEAKQLAAEADAEAHAAQQRERQRAEDAALRERLAALQSRQWLDGNVRAKEAGYAALFAELGMDPTAADPASVATAVRAHGLAADLAIGFDRWASCCRQLDMPLERTASIHAVARAVDTDPLRLRLRELVAAPDLDAVRALATATDLRTVAPASIYLLFDAARSAGAPDLAHEVLERGQIDHPQDFGLLSLLAQECAAKEDAAGEMRYALAAMALQPEGLLAGTRLAVSLAATGRVQQAELVFRRLAERHAADPGLWHNVGAALGLLGRHAEAIAALRRVEDAGVGTGRSAVVMGRSERALGRHDEARRWFATAAEREPRTSDPWVSLGAMLCDDLRDYDNALAAFDRALQVEPKSAAALRNRGVVLDFLGREDEARAQWQRFASERPELGEPLLKLAIRAFNKQDLPTAIDNAIEAVRRTPTLADAWFVLGSSLLGVGEPAAGIAALRCALRADPNHGSAWHDLGWALADKPETRNEAVKALQRAVALSPRFAMAHYNLAYALYMDGQVDACRKAVDEALRLDPDMPQAKKLRASFTDR